MSVIQKASLVLIPSGYKDSVLYSQVPNTTAGDFTFTRASSGTRVNADGYIETASVLGTTELVTNGDFSSDSSWNGINTNGVTISSGTLNYANTTISHNVSQSNILTIGKIYKVTLTISNYVKGSVLVVVGAGGAIQEISSNGTFNLYGVASINTTFYLQARGVSGTTLSIDNVSVKEVAQNNVPRLDYTDSSCPTLLLEGQRTNEITYSEDFSQWGTLGADVVEYVSTLQNPSGLLGGYKVKGSGIYLSASISGTTQRSIYARSVSGSGNVQLMSHNSNTNNVFTLTEEWQRFDLNSVTSATGQSSFYIDLRGASTTLSELYVWGAMAETGSFPTSYIPTSGTSVTRVGDVCIDAGDATIFNSSEGVLFFEAAALADDLTNKGFALSDGTSNNACRIYYANSTNNIRFFFNVGGSAQVIKSINLTDITDYNKIAFSYKSNDFKIYINGVKVAEDTSGSVPSANTFNKLSFDRGYGGENFYGKCKQLITFNEALTDSELIELTGGTATTYNWIDNDSNEIITSDGDNLIFT